MRSINNDNTCSFIFYYFSFTEKQTQTYQHKDKQYNQKAKYSRLLWTKPINSCKSMPACVVMLICAGFFCSLQTPQGYWCASTLGCQTSSGSAGQLWGAHRHLLQGFIAAFCPNSAPLAQCSPVWLFIITSRRPRSSKIQFCGSERTQD